MTTTMFLAATITLVGASVPPGPGRAERPAPAPKHDAPADAHESPKAAPSPANAPANAPTSGHGNDAANAPADAAHAAAPGTEPARTPDGSLKSLRAGNSRFASGKAKAPRRDIARVLETAKGQQPFATVVACADSRVPVEMLFDQGIGDLFVVRVAGNVCDTDEIGSVEYAAGHLHTPLIVVLGHTSCGAVKAVCEDAKVGGSIPALVANIGPAVARARRADRAGDDLVREAVTQNVWQSIEDLLAGSEEVRELVSGGKATVVGAVYDIANGRVQFLGEHPSQSGILAKAEGRGHGAAAPTKTNAGAGSDARDHGHD